LRITTARRRFVKAQGCKTVNISFRITSASLVPKESWGRLVAGATNLMPATKKLMWSPCPLIGKQGMLISTTQKMMEKVAKHGWLPMWRTAHHFIPSGLKSSSGSLVDMELN
jgi:hypothetical protein